MKKTLYIHKNESLIYLIDRIENTRSNEIDLNIDENPELFSEFINLKLLKREVEALGKSLTIISNNANVLSFVEKAGFDTAGVPGKNRISQSDFIDSSEVIRDDHLISDIKRPPFLNNIEQEKIKKHEEIDIDAENNFIEEPVNSFNYEKNQNANSFFEKSMKDKLEVQESNLFAKKTNDGNRIFKKPSLNFTFLFQNKKITSYMVLALIIVIIGGMFLFRSKADLTIVVKKETVDFTFPVSSDASVSAVDILNGKVPGQIITLEKEISGEFKATGVSSGATKSIGKLTVYNGYNAESQQLVAKTRFQTNDGKIFRLMKKSSIPGAKMSGDKVISPGMLEVDVEADKAGPEYNISPSDFVIPGFEGTDKFKLFYAKSIGSMSGGSLGETRAITKSDLDDAKSELLSQIESSKKDYLSSNIPNNLTMLDTSISEKMGTLNAPKEGLATDSFTASIKIIYTIFAFDKKDIIILANANLANKIKDDRKTYSETQVISYDGGILNLDKSSFSFSVRSSEVVGGNINISDLKVNLVGKDELEIKKVLTSNESIESAEITLWPFWSSRAPSNPDRIIIKINE
ncbi:MAG: hypothetical protein AAB614_02525 [Patescibacteria group bacterium]